MDMKASWASEHWSSNILSLLYITTDSRKCGPESSICVNTALAATPAPRLSRLNTNPETGGYRCEAHSTAAAASSVMARSEGWPRKLQKPRYEMAANMYIDAIICIRTGM